MSASFVSKFFFLLSPEHAHSLALLGLRAVGPLAARPPTIEPVSLMGIEFPNRVGLAAGYDKSGVAVDGLAALGFGFIEVGTVTPVAQPGNPRPRVLRLVEESAVINRLGFPNDGIEKVCERLITRRYRGVIGVNVGKNASTPLEEAAGDYVQCLKCAYEVADYFAINVSSPNTQGLRGLQAVQNLRPLLEALIDAREGVSGGTRKCKPIALKVSPDLQDDELESIGRLLLELRIDGVIATNTTLRRDVLNASQTVFEGGLSGRPLAPIARNVVSRLRSLLGPTFPIIGVGGVDCPESAVALRRAGADLIQLYTGLIFAGSGLPRTCMRALEDDARSRTDQANSGMGIS